MSLFDESFLNEDATSASRSLQQGSTKPPWGWVKPSRRLREGFSVSSRSLQRPRRLHEALVKTSRTLREGATASPLLGMLHEGTVRASRSLREDFAKTLRQGGFKRAWRLLPEGFEEHRGVSAGSRLRDVFAARSLWRLHEPVFRSLRGAFKWDPR